jgi:hypothetical protein
MTFRILRAPRHSTGPPGRSGPEGRQSPPSDHCGVKPLRGGMRRTLDWRPSPSRPAGPRGLRGRNGAALGAAVGRGAEVVAAAQADAFSAPVAS